MNRVAIGLAALRGVEPRGAGGQPARTTASASCTSIPITAATPGTTASRTRCSDTLAGTGVELKIIHMDTKRNPSEEFNRAAALRAKEVIESFRPDVVTTSDDNAAQYLIMPYYKDAELPFVFCGLNWDASTYGLPYANVTGMVEVSPIPQILRLLRSYAKGDRIGYLTEDTTTKRKELEYHGDCSASTTTRSTWSAPSPTGRRPSCGRRTRSTCW